jgi:hypothetical protein
VIIAGIQEQGLDDALPHQIGNDGEYADIADMTAENHGDEDGGLARLISAIKGLEGQAQR